MNMSLILYLIEFLNKINGCLFIVIVLFIIFFIFSITFNIACLIEEDDKYEGHRIEFNKFLYSKIWIFILSSSLFITIPSKETMYLMAGTSYLQNSNIPSKVSEAINLKLDDVISELKKSKKDD